MLPDTHASSNRRGFVLVTIKKRRDFQKATNGLRFSTPSFTVLRSVGLKIKNDPEAAQPSDIKCLCRQDSEFMHGHGSMKELSHSPSFIDDTTSFRFGFTVTKKLGNAVVRNRIRRRLKAAVFEAMHNTSLSADQRSSPLDFVVLARHTALTYPYSLMVSDFTRAIEKLATAPLDAKPAAKPQRPNISPISSSNKKEGLAKPPPIA